jgi:tetratricopeptide (TPR) repeat protein
VEEAEGLESGSAGVDATGSSKADPVAVAVALAGASRDKADAFLDNQNALIADQRHHLHEQTKLTRLQAEELSHELGLRHWSLWVRHASGLLKLALEVSAGLLLLAVVGGLGIMVWSAAHADGLIVESFSVPPDMASRGLTGQVVATQMLDSLSALQAQSTSIRAASSYANNWGDDLKVEIPDTGVSIGEFNRYLRQLLGHETHISGEVVRMGTAVEVTARAGTDTGETFSGTDADFHALLQRAAASVYARTQPYRYTNILIRQGKLAEEESFAEAQTRVGPPSERAWAYTALVAGLSRRGAMNEAAKAAHASVALNPDFAFGWYDVARYVMGAEEALLAARRSLRSATVDQSAESASAQRHVANNIVAGLLGDYDEQIKQVIATYPTIDLSADPATQTKQAQSSLGGGIALAAGLHGLIARHMVSKHDLAEARRILAEEPKYIAALKNIHDVRGQVIIDQASQAFQYVELSLAWETKDWRRILQLVPVMGAQAAKLAASYASTNSYPPVDLWPYLAYAEAQMGDFAAAHAWIDRTPHDCDLCLRIRAQIDLVQKNYGGADFWFANAVSKAPSVPFAYADWGQMLLERGKPDAAIEKFKLSNQKGPHFADPLEGWGEALIAKNQSHLALAKFVEAEKYAPNWGRLRLKWGEALVYAGNKSEAKAQFARAAQLDLTAAEKSELEQSLRLFAT